MPLVECQECNGSISTLANMICPHCGCPASIALTEAKPSNPAAQKQVAHDSNDEEIKTYLVTTHGDTRPFKDKLKKEFGLKWNQWQKQWRGEIVGEIHLNKFVSFCKENEIEYTAPSVEEQILPTSKNESPNTGNENSETQRKIALERAISDKSKQPEKNPKKQIPEEQKRKIDEGIGGTREDWKKNRRGYGKDMGYG